MLYVDTSMLVAALTREARTTEMQDWLSDQAAGELVISDWVVTEFSSALSIKLRTGQLDVAPRADALGLFNTIVDESFTVFPISREDFLMAARLADHHATGLRAGDALHLAVAAGRSARLCSLDRMLVNAAHELGISADLF